jgi:hypothetical protein
MEPKEVAARHAFKTGKPQRNRMLANPPPLGGGGHAVHRRNVIALMFLLRGWR